MLQIKLHNNQLSSPSLSFSPYPPPIIYMFLKSSSTG